MPYLVTCPGCSAKLKSAQPVPAGRALNCPQCKNAFTLSEPAPEIDVATPAKETAKPATVEAPKVQAQAAPAATSPAAKPSRTAPTVPADEPPRKGRKARDEVIPEAEIVDAADFDTKSKPKRGRDDDDDDRPRSRRRDEDEDDRPRSKRRDEDEDDRPRSRRRDEDEDDRPRSKRRDEDEDDRPRSKRRDDDDEADRPRSRRRDEDEDDRPAKSKRRNDDDRPRPKGPVDDFAFDDDDKPKARRSRNDDDDEDRPRARKGRDDDDDLDSEDSPRSSSRSRYKRGKKGNRKLLIALLGGGAALLLVAFVVIFLLVDPFGIVGGGGLPSEMLAWAPADTEAIFVVDVAEARKLDDFKDGMGANADGARHGIRVEEISTMMIASKSGLGGSEVVVYKLISSADQQKIISAVSGKEVTVNGKKYYRTGTNGGLYFPSSRLVVVAQSENTLQTLLQKSESSVIVSKEMRSAAGQGSGIFTIACIGKTAEVIDPVGSYAAQGGVFGPLGGKAPARSAVARSFVYSLKVSGERGTGTLTSTYDSSDTARRISEDLRKNMNQNPTMNGMIDTFEVSNNGSSVSLTLIGPVKGKKTFMPFGLR